jgi:hypothetical protein
MHPADSPRYTHVETCGDLGPGKFESQREVSLSVTQSGQDKSESIQDQLYPNEPGWYTALRPANTQTTPCRCNLCRSKPFQDDQPRPRAPFYEGRSQEVMRQLLEWTDDEPVRLPAEQDIGFSCDRLPLPRPLPRFALPPRDICQALPVVYIQSFLAGHSIKTMGALGGFSAGGRWPKLLDQERVVLESVLTAKSR